MESEIVSRQKPSISGTGFRAAAWTGEKGRDRTKSIHRRPRSSSRRRIGPAGCPYGRRSGGGGIYHYGVLDHELELLQKADFREAVASAALDQGFIAEAAVVFAWTAVFARSKWKYKERAYRYVYLDAGHIAQNVALAAVAL